MTKGNCAICYKQFEKINNSQLYCCEQCFMVAKRIRHRKWYNKNKKSKKTRFKGRFSGKVYENSPEKLQSIKEKYKNGITIEHIKAMLE